MSKPGVIVLMSVALLGLLLVVLAPLVGTWWNSSRPEYKAYWQGFWRRSGAPTPAGKGASTAPGDIQAVPPALNVLLPTKIRIHPFTGMRTFEEAGNVKGLDVRIEALDAWGDTIKAFGDFRFELYSFMPNSTERKADNKLVVWEVPLTDPKDNFVHWNSINRAYEFKLQWAAGITAGQRYVLVAVFTSPYTKRLFAERIFIAGQ
jgi:hypothetical protein